MGQIYDRPYCCALVFAQLGAGVIKVEPPGGEPLRFRWHDPVGSHEFVMLNSNKRSVVLDLKSDAGRQAILDLAATADVVIGNYAPGTMERLQLDAEQRSSRTGPRLVVASGEGKGRGRGRSYGSLRTHVRHGQHRACDVRRRLGDREPDEAADQGWSRVRRPSRRQLQVMRVYGQMADEPA